MLETIHLYRFIIKEWLGLEIGRSFLLHGIITQLKLQAHIKKKKKNRKRQFEMIK